MKKLFAFLLAMSIVAMAFTGCGASKDGKVYYLNFKPEQDEQWQDLAKDYTDETGVEVVVLTAASGQYETTLKSEMAKSDAPTMFQVNGPVGLASWSDYCYDMSGSDVYKALSSKDFALMDGEKALGIAYVIETYGIIYNKAIMNDYFATSGAKATSMDEIDHFDTFKAVVEDIQSKADALGIKGAFTSAGMDPSSDWRFKTHLANLPIYYEYKADAIGKTDAIKGTYLDHYKAIWDLYINNSVVDPGLLSSKTGEDSVAEFVNGDAVFYQNGTWAYGDVQGLGDENIGMMPIYIGGEGEENQALCTGSENYWCVNAKADQKDIDATLAFMNWVVTSDTGRSSLANDMGFVTPFTTFTDEYVPSNPLIKDANAYIADGKTPVAWTFTTMPSEEWKNGVGSALTAYASGTGDWSGVETAFVDGWAKEVAKVAG